MIDLSNFGGICKVGSVLSISAYPFQVLSFSQVESSALIRCIRVGQFWVTLSVTDTFVRNPLNFEQVHFLPKLE